MPKTRAAELIKAAEKARRADRRVSAAQRALTLAVKAREKVEAKYLELVRASVCPTTGKEGDVDQASA